MTKSAQRSAMWPPSTTQSATEDEPYRGIQNRTAGEIYSITERNRPQHQPRLAFRQSAGDPEHRRHRQPGGDADGIQPRQRPRRRRRDPEKDRLADLHRGVGDGKPQSAPVKCRRDRGRQHQSAEHHRKQQQANRGLFRIEPVGDPGGVDPHPPHREKQQRDLQYAQRREMSQQRMRDLRDRKDEDEIEEQLGIGHAVVLVRRDLAKHRAVWLFRHRCPAAARPGLTLGHPGPPGTPVCSASACSTPPICPLSDW